MLVFPVWLWHNSDMPRLDTLLGQKLENYRIERLLGRGGMASVYYAVDIQLQRPAALKVIDIHFGEGADYSERFVTEARAMASWRHPNIPQIYQAGVKDGFSFYAMEYVPGMDLEKYLSYSTEKGELLPIEDVILIGRAIASALDYAHQRGVVHRDVKPSNVLISEDDRILLSDFGLVLVKDKGTHGEVFGSPHYIAPEQARSSAQAVPQSDIYSLGIILYEMLVGILPFDDPSPAAVALQQITQNPPLPRQFNPNLRPEVEAVLLKALQKQPHERYQTGIELMDALEAAGTIANTSITRSGRLSVPPGTLAFLSSGSGTSTPATVSHLEIPVDDPIHGETGSELPEGTSALPGKGSHRVLPLKTLLITAVLAGCALTSICAILFLPRWVSAMQERISAAKSSSSATPGVIAGLSVTSTPIISTLESTTVTPTETVMPTNVPGTETTTLGSYQILITVMKDGSLFLINQGTLSLPLSLIRFETEEHELMGSEWGIDFLQPGHCVAILKKNGNSEPQKGINCALVGEQFQLSGSGRFWNEKFDVFFSDQRVGTCNKNAEDCKIVFGIHP